MSPELKKKMISAALIGGGSILGLELLKGAVGVGKGLLPHVPTLYVGRQTKKTREATESIDRNTMETNRLLAELVESNRRKTKVPAYTLKVEPLT
jgi:hypothetical protein